MSGLCPYCSGVMENGYLQGSHGIAYVKKPRWLMPRKGEGDFKVPVSFMEGAYPLQYCSRCRKIILSM